MTGLLEKALHRVEALSPEDQDAIAAQILDSLDDDDESWSHSFAANPEKLRRLAEEAISEHRRGLTRPIEELFNE